MLIFIIIRGDLKSTTDSPFKVLTKEKWFASELLRFVVQQLVLSTFAFLVKLDIHKNTSLRLKESSNVTVTLHIGI
jgi:hypothetical protein